MPILRIKRRDNPFVQIDKRCLEDARLSWRARGILGYLLTKPEGWRVSIKDLWKNGTEGRNAVQDCMAELAKFGYAYLETVRGEDGRMGGKEWVICEEPKTGFSETESEDTDKPTNRQTENRVFGLYSNNDYLVIEEVEVSAGAKTFPVRREESEEVGGSAAPPPMPPGPATAYGFDAVNEAARFAADPVAADRFGMADGKGSAGVQERFAETVSLFVKDQAAVTTLWQNARDFRQHFFNWLPSHLQRQKQAGAGPQQGSYNRNGQPQQPEPQLPYYRRLS